MPIDKTFRETWIKSSQHKGHPVWHSPVNDELEIHGDIVGVDFNLCYGCEKCIDACPTQVFELMNHSSGKVADPYHESDCIFCLVCEITCPVDAISIKSAVGSDDTLDSLLNG